MSAAELDPFCRFDPPAGRSRPAHTISMEKAPDLQLRIIKRADGDGVDAVLIQTQRAVAPRPLDGFYAAVLLLVGDIIFSIHRHCLIPVIFFDFVLLQDKIIPVSGYHCFCPLSRHFVLK